MSSVHRAPPQRVIHEARSVPSPQRRYTPLLLIPSEGQVNLVALNPCVTRVLLHWSADDRNVVWCDESKHCRGCLRGWGRRLNYYLPVLVGGTERQHLLSIPSQAYAYSESLQRFNDELRGRVLLAGRLKAGKRAPVKIEVTNRVVSENTLPIGWDALSDLAARWGLVSPGDAYEGSHP